MALARDLANAADRDPGGRAVHDALVVAAACLLSWPTTFLEIAVWPAVIYAVLRAPRIGRVYLRAACRPLAMVLAGLALWLAVGLIATPDLAVGVDELGGLRWMVLLIAALPVVGRTPRSRGRVVWAAVAGIAVGHVFQCVQAAGIAFDIDAIDFDRYPDRVSGWWDPAVAGTVLTIGLGLVLPLAIGGAWQDGPSRRARTLAIVAAAAAVVGLLATGSRGGWLASAALIAFIGVAALWTRRIGWRSGATVACLAAFAIAAGLLLLGDRISGRFEAAAREVRLAISEGAYDTDTGARIGMKRWAIEIGAARAITGVGSGGFANAARDALEDASPATDPARVHDHAHDQWLHTFATRGLVGVLLVGLLFWRATANAVRIARDARVDAHQDRDAAGGRRPAPWTINDGPWAALVGVLLITPFDAVLISTQSAALVALLVTLSPDVTAWSPGRRSLGGGAGP